jgi:hypothetical protein
VKELLAKTVALRDKVRHGDPILLASRFGEGRVIVCLTSAGKQWNDWASGVAAPSYVMLLAEMAKYLAN